MTAVTATARRRDRVVICHPAVSAAALAHGLSRPSPGDFPARKPGEPSVTAVTRRIEFHLLYPWQVA